MGEINFINRIQFQDLCVYSQKKNGDECGNKRVNGIERMDLVKKQYDVTQWVNEYSGTLFGYALQRLRDREVAADLVQETFLAAWRNVDTYNGEASVKTWLFTILKNKIIDYYRQVVSRQATFVQTGDDPFFDEADHWKDGVCPQDWGANPESHMHTKEFYSVLNGCKGKLKEIYSAVFTMKYLDDLQSEEICKVLNITPSNYWVIIHRAKTQLRSCLEINWFKR